MAVGDCTPMNRSLDNIGVSKKERKESYDAAMEILKDTQKNVNAYSPNTISARAELATAFLLAAGVRV